MIDLGFKLHHMQFILAIILIFFFILYYKLASSLIKARFLLFLFMLNLILFRFLGLTFHAISSPQANPIRLDLWLPLFYIVTKFGFLSPVTSISFALAYLADDFFGLLMLAVYIIAIIFPVLRAIIKKDVTNLPKICFLLVPISLALYLHFYFFGTIISQSAKLVNDLKYWQMVISPYSMFWPFLLVFPLFLYISLHGRNQFQKQIYVFLLGLASVELIYFYGRSHEHNLLTTSGILLLILYLTLDKLKGVYKLKWNLYLVPLFLLIAITVLFSQYIILNLKTVFTRLSSGHILESNQIDKNIDRNPMFFDNYLTNKIFLMGFNDAYLNYRYNLTQIGYYSPFVANLYKDETIDLLKSLSLKGYTLLYEEGAWFNLDEYNNYLKNSNIQFQSSRAKSLGELQFNELKIVEK